MFYEKITPGNTAVLVVDVQERMMRVIAGREEVERNCALLLRAATTLAMPILVTTQNRARIGATLPEIRDLLGQEAEIDKMEFSCFANAGFTARVAAMERQPENIIICGVESHICIYQTVRDGIAAGMRLFVAADAVSSRNRVNHRLGLARARELGAVVAGTEMLIYELLERAGTPEFKALLPYLK